MFSKSHLIIDVEFYTVGVDKGSLELTYIIKPWDNYVTLIQEGIIKEAEEFFGEMDGFKTNINADNHLVVSFKTDFPFITLENIKNGERTLIRKWEERK